MILHFFPPILFLVKPIFKGKTLESQFFPESEFLSHIFYTVAMKDLTSSKTKLATVLCLQNISGGYCPS